MSEHEGYEQGRNLDMTFWLHFDTAAWGRAVKQFREQARTETNPWNRGHLKGRADALSALIDERRNG